MVDHPCQLTLLPLERVIPCPLLRGRANLKTHTHKVVAAPVIVGFPRPDEGKGVFPHKASKHGVHSRSGSSDDPPLAEAPNSYTNPLNMEGPQGGPTTRNARTRKEGFFPPQPVQARGGFSLTHVSADEAPPAQVRLAWRPHALVQGAGLTACLRCGTSSSSKADRWRHNSCANEVGTLPSALSTRLLTGAFDSDLFKSTPMARRAKAHGWEPPFPCLPKRLRREGIG